MAGRTDLRGQADAQGDRSRLLVSAALFRSAWGNAQWRRLTEEHGGRREAFHFDMQGSVAKSTRAGIPWLHFIRHRLGDRVHFWPFDGWEIPSRPGENDRSGLSYDLLAMERRAL
jgi:hypothetical protein